MIILGIESSCDETSAAVVRMEAGKREILSNIVASQIDIHKRYGGVVPEVAGRAHIEAVSRITYEALEDAGVKVDDIDAVGVTASPGLIGALLVGVNFAKAFAFANSKPLVPVNHVKGHIAATYLCHEKLEPPFLAIVVSGGHTSIYDAVSYTDMREIGYTRDDAAGEAFDKAARMLGIPYPGGAEMDLLAGSGDPRAIKFPSPAIGGDSLEFSFSGLKTAVINYVHTCEMRGEKIVREDVAASYTRVVCEAVTEKLSLALDRTGHKNIVLGGGVAANSHLRQAIGELCAKRGVGLFMPDKKLCGDNAAMIAAQAYYEFLDGNTADTTLNARASDE